MGFWDFVAPDFVAFRSRLLDVTPDYVVLGPVVLSQEELISLAWSNPGSGAGVAARLYLAAQDYSVPRTLADPLWDQVQRNMTDPRFGEGGGFGGAFDVFRGVLMPALVIPGAFRVAIEATAGGRPVTNVVGVVNASGSAQGAADAVRAAWKATGGPLGYLPGQVSLLGFRATDLSSADGEIVNVADTSTGGGGQAAGLATNAACALVKWSGGTRSRSSSGRLYYGPLNEAMIAADGRTLEAASATAITNAFTTFRSSLDSAGYPLAVLSVTRATAYPIANVSVEGIIATQRRRIRG